jgi:hypothetical protein
LRWNRKRAKENQLHSTMRRQRESEYFSCAT